MRWDSRARDVMEKSGLVPLRRYCHARTAEFRNDSLVGEVVGEGRHTDRRWLGGWRREYPVVSHRVVVWYRQAFSYHGGLNQRGHEATWFRLYGAAANTLHTTPTPN